jgi:GR25 family glycosyltransferase involved in LPS biosynthesis
MGIIQKMILGQKLTADEIAKLPPDRQAAYLPKLTPSQKVKAGQELTEAEEAKLPKWQQIRRQKRPAGSATKIASFAQAALLGRYVPDGVRKAREIVCRGCDQVRKDDKVYWCSACGCGVSGETRKIANLAAYEENLPRWGCKHPKREQGLGWGRLELQPLSDTELLSYFGRVVVISLRRTPERLAGFRARLSQIDWPLQDPVVFDAVDGSKVPAPAWFKQGGGAWGCLQSHRRVIEEAMQDNLSNLLILEDDCAFPPDVRRRLSVFLSAIGPENWHCLMIGGQQFRDGFCRPVAPGVFRISQCERTHCYALSREGMKSLYRYWSSGKDGHCDWLLGEWQGTKGIRTFRPDPIIAIQAENQSTITGLHERSRSWDAKVKASEIGAGVALKDYSSWQQR